MYTTLHPSPVGDLLLSADDHGRLTELFTRHDGAVTTDWPFPEISAQIDAYFAGEREDFDLELAPSGTDFQLRVWDELVRVPMAGRSATRSSPTGWAIRSWSVRSGWRTGATRSRSSSPATE